MLIQGYTTLDEVLERLQRAPYHFNVDRYDAAEWVWDIIGLLRIPYALEDKYTDPAITFEEWQVNVPVDCYRIKYIKDTATGVSLTPSTDVFHRYNSSTTGTETTSSDTVYFEGPTVVVDANGEIDTANTTVFLAQGNHGFAQQMTYQEVNGKIYFGYKTGSVVINYDAFPVEDNGMPKIPKDPAYMRAVELHIACNFALGLYIRGQISKDILDRLEQKLMFAKANVDGKSKMPDEGTMEAIKNMQVRLIKTYNQFKGNFKYLNEMESLRKI
jgi:hypothetical protein